MPAYHIIWTIGNVDNKHRKTFRNLEQVSLHKGFTFYKISLSGTLLDICKMSTNNWNKICRSFLQSEQVMLVCVKLVAPTNLFVTTGYLYVQRTETFVDVNKIHVVKKKVRPIAEQTENESRKLWKEVTAGLR